MIKLEMTFQELKGKILFWVILISVIGALLSRDSNKALLWLGVLILGIIMYQVVGRFFLAITREKIDPLNIKGQDLFPEKEKDNQKDSESTQKKSNDDSAYNRIEQKLLKSYSQILATMGVPDAAKSAKDMLDGSIEKSKQEETYNLPPDFGNIILKQQKAEDPFTEKIAGLIRTTLSAKKAEGVKNKDIRWWWNLNDVERYMMMAMDEFNKVTLFLDFLARGYNFKEADKKVWQYQPKYGLGLDEKVEETSKTNQKDSPLPIELKDRINNYIERRSQENSKKYEEDIQKFSTFNAFIRNEIKLGHV